MKESQLIKNNKPLSQRTLHIREKNELCLRVQSMFLSPSHLLLFIASQSNSPNTVHTVRLDLLVPVIDKKL
jgi:hypothetical protein